MSRPNQSVGEAILTFCHVEYGDVVYTASKDKKSCEEDIQRKMQILSSRRDESGVPRSSLVCFDELCSPDAGN